VDRLDALEPERAGDFAPDHRAGAGDAGRDRGGGEQAERDAALEGGGDQARASTATSRQKTAAGEARG
jgi:hypothetical protein